MYKAKASPVTDSRGGPARHAPDLKQVAHQSEKHLLGPTRLGWYGEAKTTAWTVTAEYGTEAIYTTAPGARVKPEQLRLAHSST